MVRPLLCVYFTYFPNGQFIEVEGKPVWVFDVIGSFLLMGGIICVCSLVQNLTSLLASSLHVPCKFRASSGAIALQENEQRNCVARPHEGIRGFCTKCNWVARFRATQLLRCTFSCNSFLQVPLIETCKWLVQATYVARDCSIGLAGARMPQLARIPGPLLYLLPSSPSIKHQPPPRT